MQIKDLHNISANNWNDVFEEGMRKGYNKAIDDCLKIVEWDGYTLDIKNMIEKLKEGVENE